ncbi:MAG: hypothetical protein QGG40_14380 [Myxococcota bacterium]|nr:hypothetical protein [Myxococcota bacterium]
MHNLEYLLVLLSRRIGDEAKHGELAEAALQLASISHSYEPSDDEVEAAVDPLVTRWRDLYGGGDAD